MTPIFPARVEKGKVILKDLSTWNAYVGKFEGQEVGVTIGKRRKPRSEQENDYYWCVIVKTLADELGYLTDEMHDALKWKFLKTGRPDFPTVRSTTTLSTVEMEEYLSQIRTWASVDMNIYLPTPNEAL